MRLTLPASCGLYQLNYQLVLLEATFFPVSEQFVIGGWKRICIILERIRISYVEGISAFYSNIGNVWEKCKLQIK